MEITKRPRGLAPGNPEWFKEVVGPKLLTRLHDEIEAQPVGELNPTGARLLVAGLGLCYPTVSAVHVTHETPLANVPTAELEQRLQQLALERQRELATTVDYTERVIPAGAVIAQRDAS